ncbi:MAG: hypothetical protein WA021_02315 [Minisyncoccia bacterium]
MELSKRHDLITAFFVHTMRQELKENKDAFRAMREFTELLEDDLECDEWATPEEILEAIGIVISGEVRPSAFMYNAIVRAISKSDPVAPVAEAISGILELTSDLGVAFETKNEEYRQLVAAIYDDAEMLRKKTVSS